MQPRAANLPEIPAAALRFSQTDSGLKLQLDLTISGEMNLGAMERELLRVILLEMIYRNQTAIQSGEAYVEAPDWLVEGLLALTPNRDCLLLAKSERITPLDEFLRQRPELLDSAGRLFYRAYSFALVQSVVESADGRARALGVTSTISRLLQMICSQICRPLFHNLPETIWEKSGNR